MSSQRRVYLLGLTSYTSQTLFILPHLLLLLDLLQFSSCDSRETLDPICPQSNLPTV